MKKAMLYAIRWYGRGCDYDNSTHGNLSDFLPGRYNTQGEALKVVTELTEIADKYKRRRGEFLSEINALHRDEHNEITQFLKDRGHEMV